MANATDTFRTQRDSVLSIFRIAASTRDADFSDAFNKAATFIENTPGIVEYFARERGPGPFTDGMDFRRTLHEVASKAALYPLRVRAIEAIGNISTRYADFVQSFYDMQLLTRLACSAPRGDIAGAAITAMCKIGSCDTLQPAPNMHTGQFDMYAGGAGALPFRSRFAPHDPIGRNARYDAPAHVTYPEVAIAVAAQVLMTNPDPGARVTAAENLRAIAWAHRNDAEDGKGNLRSLVCCVVDQHKPDESDARVRDALDNIEADYWQAEKDKQQAAKDMAAALDAQTRAAEKEARDAVITVKETMKVGKPLTLKKTPSAPVPPRAAKKRWWSRG